jgi:energy-coupling factor transporter transmembrane protein EcfT
MAVAATASSIEKGENLATAMAARYFPADARGWSRREQTAKPMGCWRKSRF